jgi:hypothetical protein
MPTGSPWRWTCHSLSSWDRDRQEWYATIRQALIDGRALPAPTGGDPFSLADPDLVEGILTKRASPK